MLCWFIHPFILEKYKQEVNEQQRERVTPSVLQCGSVAALFIRNIYRSAFIQVYPN